jgi:hypothetical protein
VRASETMTAEQVRALLAKGKRKRAPSPAISPGWVVTLELATRLYSTANSRTHWAVQSRRKKEQRAAFDQAVTLAGLRSWHPDQFPLSVTITHQTPGALMDDDNLTISAKGLRDHVAKWLGVDDAPDSPVKFAVVQCPGVAGVFVRIEPGRKD